jgi:hypothetical protein
MRVSITFDAVTEECVTDGDTSDNGYICPRTEGRRSFRTRGERYIKAARNGRYDWPSLRRALEWLGAQNCAEYKTCWTRSDDCMSIDARGAYETHTSDRRPGEISLSYTLHIEGATYGTLDRIARLLSGRVYFANVPQLNRRKAG